MPYYKFKNYKRALEKFKSNRIKFFVAYNNLGNVFQELKNYNQAILYESTKDHKEIQYS